MSPSQFRNGQEEMERTLPFTAEEITLPPTAPVEQFTGRNMSLAVGTRSNPGIKRQHKPNEDSLFAAQGERTHDSHAQQFGLFVVADGMGGHANGQDASRLAIQTIVDCVLPRLSGSEQFTDDALVQLLIDGVKEANLAVHQRNMEHRADMGTTMTAALVVGAMVYVANVGDSRTYLYRQGEGLKKITNDHSVVASLVEAGIIKPDDIYTHPKRNQIYRSLGEKPVIDVDSFKVPLQPGDKLLLCSDGLWDMVRDPAIEQILKSVPDPSQTGNALIKAALEGGGEDNVSVIVVYISETTQRTGMTGVQLLARPESPQYPPM
jgi:serine/threonine protein phosphatase PrpC